MLSVHHGSPGAGGAVWFMEMTREKRKGLVSAVSVFVFLPFYPAQNPSPWKPGSVFPSSSMSQTIAPQVCLVANSQMYPEVYLVADSQMYPEVCHVADSQLYPEVCHVRDSKSSQADNQHLASHLPILPKTITI